MATPFAQFQRIFGFVRHSKPHAGANHSFMRFVIPVHHTQGASRHHGGAATGDMRTIYRLKRRQILSRFPSQNRRDQARQQLTGGPADRFPTQNRAIRRGSNRLSALPTAS